MQSFKRTFVQWWLRSVELYSNLPFRPF